jgi:hypothetical protein
MKSGRAHSRCPREEIHMNLFLRTVLHFETLLMFEAG